MPPSNLTSLLSLSLTQLNRLARLTGVSTPTRTKALLAQAIQHAAESSHTIQDSPTQPLRILSIDVGIKNLAFCLLESPALSNTPVVQRWKCIDVSSHPGLNLDADGRDLNAATADADADAHSDTYSTPALARAASRFIHETILPHAPSHVLIERQRWRTGGAAGVLQWTIRVNSFEAMLWAALTTARQAGMWSGEVHAVSPAAVAGMWLGRERGEIEGGTGKGSTMRRYQALKLAKVRLLKDWIHDGAVVQNGNEECDAVFAVLRGESAQAGDMGSAPRRKRSSRAAGSGAGGSGAGKAAKMDDLADCLIQGVTWLHWLRNARLIAKRGLDGARELLSQTLPGGLEVKR